MPKEFKNTAKKNPSWRIKSKYQSTTAASRRHHAAAAAIQTLKRHVHKVIKRAKVDEP